MRLLHVEFRLYSIFGGDFSHKKRSKKPRDFGRRGQKCSLVLPRQLFGVHNALNLGESSAMRDHGHVLHDIH